MFKLQYQTASVRLQVVHEIMRDLKVGEYTIKLNHRLLLDAMMRVRPVHKLPCCAHLPHCQHVCEGTCDGQAPVWVQDHLVTRLYGFLPP